MIDVPALVADATSAEVFCCGPTQLIDAVDAEMARVGRGERLHIERFGPVSRSGSAAAAAFEVELAHRARRRRRIRADRARRCARSRCERALLVRDGHLRHLRDEGAVRACRPP